LNESGRQPNSQLFFVAKLALLRIVELEVIKDGKEHTLGNHGPEIGRELGTIGFQGFKQVCETTVTCCEQ
jgi:hypothetical protein